MNKLHINYRFYILPGLKTDKYILKIENKWTKRQHFLRNSEETIYFPSTKTINSNILLILFFLLFLMNCIGC